MRKTSFIKNLESGPKSALSIGFVACLNDPTIINLGTAENHLINDFLLPIFRERPEFQPEDFTYFASSKKLLDAVAQLYRDYFGMKDAQGDEIMLGSGIAFLVEKIGLVLCEEGDVVLIPKPCYGCFEPDLQQCKCKVQYIDLDNLPEKPPENAKLLILTNPGNPIGDTIKDQDKLLEWAYQVPDLHIVTDDVYALSNRKGEDYVSIAAHPKADPMKVHQFYGISKDWGLAGLHVGFFWTKNKELLQMMQLAAGCFHLSSDTIQILTRMFSDIPLRDKMISEFRKRLTVQYDKTMKLLKDSGFEVNGCDNSLFIMVNLSDIAGTPEKEIEVFKTLIQRFKVHILPGYNGFHCDNAGWFRLCFSIKWELVEEGINRLKKAVETLRAEAK